MENNKITQIQPQSVQPISTAPPPDVGVLLTAIAQKLAEAKTENHLHIHNAPQPTVPPQQGCPQDHQNAVVLLQALAGLAIIFCLTFGTLSTIILIWRGAQATDFSAHTLK